MQQSIEWIQRSAIMGIGSDAREREFGHVCPPHDHGAGRTQPPDDFGVLFSERSRSEDRRTGGCRLSLNIDVVFYGYRKPGQRRSRGAAFPQHVQGLRLALMFLVTNVRAPSPDGSFNRWTAVATISAQFTRPASIASFKPAMVAGGCIHLSTRAAGWSSFP